MSKFTTKNNQVIHGKLVIADCRSMEWAAEIVSAMNNADAEYKQTFETFDDETGDENRRLTNENTRTPN